MILFSTLLQSVHLLSLIYQVGWVGLVTKMRAQPSASGGLVGDQTPISSHCEIGILSQKWT